MRRYLVILRHGPAARPFAAAVVARLPISMVPLGMVLLVQDVRGSYGIAGLMSATFALATAVAMPTWGRLLDRLGQPRVVAPTSAVSAVALAAFAVAAVNGAGNAVLLVLAALVGLFFPPMSPAMRAAFRVALPREEDRRAAYALDAVAIETIFVVGPLVLSALLVVTAPVVPLVVTAVLLGAGANAYALTSAARSWRAEASTAPGGVRGPSPLRSKGVVAVLLVALAMAVGFGQTDVAIPATARETFGDEALVGLLFACIAGGSATGGLLYGARRWRGVERTRLVLTMSLFASGLALLWIVVRGGEPSFVVLLPALVVTGVAVAPSLIVLANLVDHLAPRDRLGEAQAWLNTAFTSGGALGAAVAGLLVDAGGPARAFAGAAEVLAAGAALALLAQPALRPADALEHAPTPA